MNGGMAEWLKAAVLKTVSGVTRSGVRIPLPPPIFLEMLIVAVRSTLPAKVVFGHSLEVIFFPTKID
jgi:hypothetical protein